MAEAASDNTIKLVIPGEPKAQQRHRYHLQTKAGRGVKVKLEDGRIVTLYDKKDFWIQEYDPSAKDKKNIRQVLQLLMPPVELAGPLRVDRYYYFGHLKGHYGTGRNSNTLKGNTPLWKDTGKDFDNLDKLILDALTGLFFKNDSQVCKGDLIKQYSEVPRTEIYITPLDNQKKLFE
jgi:Holliday junction resolvase RusA-like endonuclease